MSRVSLIEQLYAPKKKSALEFDYDSLWAPPIRSIMSQEDINELCRIATSLRLSGNINKKYELIDSIMRRRGFKKGNSGTNRVVYNFLEDPTFVAKVAVDKVGMKDSPAEYKNQEFFKPFCCKIFEVDPSGVIAFVERVNPISSLEEFYSVSGDIFNMMITKIIGKYVVDDLGADKPFNYGIRQNSHGYTFGPVILDFPYAYKLDAGKLFCTKEIQTPAGATICKGEIDYDASLSHLVCTKCGKRYTAQELAKDESCVIHFYEDDVKGAITMRARIVDAKGNVIKDSGRSSKLYLTEDEYKAAHAIVPEGIEPRKVTKKVKIRGKNIQQKRKDVYSQLQIEFHKELIKKQKFNPVIDTEIKAKAIHSSKPVPETDICASEEPTVYGISKKAKSVFLYGDNQPIEDRKEVTIPTSEVGSESIKVEAAVMNTDSINKNMRTFEGINMEQIEKDAIPEMHTAISGESEDLEEDINYQFQKDLASTIMDALRNGAPEEEPDWSSYDPGASNEEDVPTDEGEYDDQYDEYTEYNGRNKRKKPKKFEDMSEY